jgi:hypothetical protein
MPATRMLVAARPLVQSDDGGPDVGNTMWVDDQRRSV